MVVKHKKKKIKKEEEPCPLSINTLKGPIQLKRMNRNHMSLDCIKPV